jgi:hypothetical protein
MMILSIALLINNVGLFVLEIIGYHICHSGKCSDFVFIRIKISN